MGVWLIGAGLVCTVALVVVLARQDARDRYAVPAVPLRGPGVGGWLLLVAALSFIVGGLWQLGQPVLALFSG